MGAHSRASMSDWKMVRIRVSTTAFRAESAIDHPPRLNLWRETTWSSGRDLPVPVRDRLADRPASIVMADGLQRHRHFSGDGVAPAAR